MRRSFFKAIAVSMKNGHRLCQVYAASRRARTFLASWTYFPCRSHAVWTSGVRAKADQGKKTESSLLGLMASHYNHGMAFLQRKNRGRSMFHDTDTDLAASSAYLHESQLHADPRGKHIVDAENAWVKRYIDTLPANARVVDVPCGNGRMSRIVAGRGDLNLVAIDFNAHMLEAMATQDATSMSPRRARLVRGDVLSLPLEDQSIDLVLNIRLMHHIADRDTQVAMYRELGRVCRGLIVSTFWTTHCWRYLRKRLLGKRIKSYPVSPAHFRSVVTEAGLTLESYQPLRPWYDYQCMAICRPDSRPQSIS